MKCSGSVDCGIGDGAESVELRDAHARTSYLEMALSEVLAKPLVFCELGPSICGIVFGRLAFLNCGGEISTAFHDRGLLTDTGGQLWPHVDCLPVRPSVSGIREIAKEAICLRVASSLAALSGEVVDLRELNASPWRLERGQGLAASFLELEAERVVRSVPAKVWRRIARHLYRGLRTDRSLVLASQWAVLGAGNSLEAYEGLRHSGLRPFDTEPGPQRTLAANAISAVIERGGRCHSLREEVRAFQLNLYNAGVTPVGWRLLLDSPLSYWRKLMKGGSYDIEVTSISLLLGQKLSPPRLPDPRFITEIRDIKFEHQLEDGLRHIPPQIWRTSYAIFEARGWRSLRELREVVPWAARLGADLPKQVRNSGWDALMKRALDHLVVEAICGTALTANKFVDEAAYAMELTNERAVSRIAEMMSNCLETYWPRIEARSTRCFIAVLDDKRAVISLKRNRDGSGWSVDQVKGPRNKAPDSRFARFADRLCEECNSCPTSSHIAAGQH